MTDLPYYGCWNTGEREGGYSPDWQYEQINAGKHIGPAFEFWSDSLPSNVRETKADYFEPLWSHCRDNSLPLHFVGRNFLTMFKDFEPWKSMTENHPFLEYTDGRINRGYLSPWNNQAHHWFDLGTMVGEYFRHEFAEDYGQPPFVYLGDNNELGLTPLNEAKLDKAFPAYLIGADDQLTLRELWDGYRIRRGMFLDGIRQACPQWADVLHVVAYADFGNEFNRSESNNYPNPYRYPWSGPDGRQESLGYDGVTANIGYLHDWSNISPHKVRSPQLEASNARFALKRYRDAVNPKFWLESHFWNGQQVSADVWLGVIRYVMWVMRQPSNRLFLGSAETVADTYEQHMKPLETAVQEVHDNQTLRIFWQLGELLPNRWVRDWDKQPTYNQNDKYDGYGHPYYWTKSLPPECQDPGDRWFQQHVPDNQRLIDWTTIGGSQPILWDQWQTDRSHQFDVEVFSFAMKAGDTYLIFASSPKGARQDVEIQVCPDGHEPRFSITVDVPVSGGFWLHRPETTKPLSGNIELVAV